MRESAAPGLRMKTRRAVTEALADTALDLFDRAGFDEVTVADIVAAAGISQRSFFRYFSSKEDVVFGDRIPSAEEVRGELLRHLDDLPPWDALRATFRTAAHQLDADQGHWKRAARVICRNPGLRARYLEKHLAWTDALAPEIVSRTTPEGPEAELRAHTMINTALGCFDVALMRWSDNDTDHPLTALVDDVFGFVHFPRP
ncbi:MULTISPECIES: TetR family transcriptional regulator [unclassified Streptomyces]|uniref:TetR family transcriptional regulator n=1 Tax=unclassified Streptomyces TaxID=2593676 RepID=UPI0003A27BF7|nr:TetR family transcriptional regulator [Streptomyces sp. LaPpAH-202]